MASSVLILEDDQTVTAAITAFLERKGIEVFATSHTDDARLKLRENRVKVLIVDCLLPGESGVDFVNNIRKEFPATVLDTVLISGVFVEPAFIKESVRNTQSVGFLKKPFQNEELLPFVEKLLANSEKGSPRKSLYQIFGNPAASDRDRLRVLESLEELHGYDLPFIYMFLMKSRISGHLNIVDAKQQVFGVTFSKGTITAVDLADADTYLGKLLLESGYIMPEDLEQALAIKSTKKLGERLIHAQFLSPHGFEQVLANQMSLRLSRTVVNQSVGVNFVADQIESNRSHIDEETLLRFVHDWIASKIDLEWLKAHYTPWGNSGLVSTGDLSGGTIRSSALVATHPQLVELVQSGLSINEIIESHKMSESAFLKGLHYLFCSGAVSLQARARARTAEDQAKHLRNVHAQFNGKNPVEIYELMVRMTTATDDQPIQVLNEFLILLGSPPSDPKVVSVYNQVKAMAERTIEAVKDGNHLKLKDDLARQEVEKKLKAGSVFEQGRALIEKAQFPQALQYLERVEKLDPRFDKIKLYTAWCRLANIDSHPNRTAAFKAIDNDLLAVTPEEKFDALYVFVMGLYSRARGDMSMARKNFEKAMAMDPGFVPAKRELMQVLNQNKPQKDVFNQDLKTLVGGFFGRKK